MASQVNVFADPPAGSRIAQGLAKIGMVLRSRAWQEGFTQDLTPTQGQVLTHLDRRDGSTLNEVADALGVRASTASEAVAVLERKGLVQKERSPEDGRRLALHLTAAGKTEAGRVATWPDFLAEIVDTLSLEEQGVLMRLLQRMIRGLQLRGEISVARMCTTCQFFRPHVHPDPSRPHHCAYVNAPMEDRDLRLDCPEHDAATGSLAAANWERFVAAGTPVLPL
jgi:DNA-binding MarR family transcriptional regulator